ncbi:hypothetical protein M3P05_20020 [Sansalvadorimonas sp. 2012CJ34-2]|uniref:Uncharacterized protein n=1 Tax=Parendozoicomonas callyspongiae TaxID=2942213 RepID=A0ABT0PN99_9GAMM|nr:DUF1629 domain-containing protein [Sansalvadorimonas sp. 2012CJ34-2]MCL6272212.1 hypothetical protein [Sansalvadorimonas sp. 2012CJ34-2]
MTIYSIKNDGYEYQELCLPITALMDAAPDSVPSRDVMKFHARNLAMRSWWKPLNVNFAPVQDKPDAPLPDVCVWRGSTLVLSEKAYQVLSSILEPFGELLPVTQNSENYYLFNCLTLGLADELNSEQDIQSGVYMGVKRLAFNTVDVEGKSVFKTKFNRCMSLFCDDALPTLVEEHHLKGLIFSTDLASEF